MANWKRKAAAIVGLALALAAPAAWAGVPSEEEQRALARLAQLLEGSVVYGHKGRIHKVVIGNSEAVDLGPGRCARFSPDGKRLAVYHAGAVYVMNAEGGERAELAPASEDSGCPVEFHTNGREVIFLRKRHGFFAVRIDDRSVREIGTGPGFTGEPGIAADGKRFAANWGNDLYAVDLGTGARRKFAKGCSPGVSPDGAWLMRNVGGHHRMRIESWEGDRGFEIDASTCLPDKRWDNHHWSNHINYIAAQGDGDGHFAYVFDIAANRGTRVTWERSEDPDLFVKRAARVGAFAASPPLAPATPPRASVVGKWPGNEEALLFLWEDATKPNEIRAPGRPLQTCRAEPRDGARFSRHHGMDLGGGGFIAEGDGARLLEELRRRGTLTIEAVVTPDGAAREREGGKIVSFADNFVLRDSREDLRFFLHTSDARAGRDGDEQRETVLGALASDRPTHIIVSYRPGLLAYYADGHEVFRTALLRGDLAAFAPGPLVFGAGARDRRPWRGALEAVAIYGRFVGAAEAAHKHGLVRARLAQKSAAPALTARGRAVEVSALPDVAAIAPYRRALVIATYEITEGPDALKDKRVQVAHWGILDARVVNRTARLRPGDQRKLRLEPFDAHPELESERLLNDSVATDLPLYLEASPIDRNDLRGPESNMARRE